MSNRRLNPKVSNMNRSLVAIAVAALLPFAAQATEYIQNGSFEQNTASSTTSDQTFMYYNPYLPTNQSSITGWTISSQPWVVVDYYNNASATATGGNWYTNTPNLTYALPTSYNDVSTVAGAALQPGAVQVDPDGGYFIGLDGNVAANPGATFVSQTVNGLTVGSTYNLSFWWAATQMNAEQGATTEALNVTFGNQSQSTPVVSECTHCFSGWMQSTMSFVADSTSELLTFASLGTPYGMPPMALLDGVSLTDAVTAPVPEPATWLMLLAGCSVMGANGLRRRRAARAADAR